MNYYHDLITEKSWRELQKLKKSLDFILIGGWAVYLYTKNLKSKDIDIIVDYDQLSTLNKIYQLSKNERLKKYEARKREITIDIYLPYYSKIGIPVEELTKHTINLEGFTTLEIEYLFALKLFVFSQRKNTLKGRKDLADLISLFSCSAKNLNLLRKLIKKYSLQTALQDFIIALTQTWDFPELSLNRHHFALFKKRARKVFATLNL